MKFRKKPIVIEAIQYTDENYTYLLYKFPECFGDIIIKNQDEIIIHTLEGSMVAKKGDYIIKGIKGEFYPCKADIFEASYEKVIE